MPMRPGSALHPHLQSVELNRICPERGEWRFYAMEITFDLFGTPVVLRNWGRIGTKGRLRTDPHADVASASTAMNSLADLKRRRGYSDVERSGVVRTGTADIGQPMNVVP
jgi:predicted DNA-binding WGR domain protein